MYSIQAKKKSIDPKCITWWIFTKSTPIYQETKLLPEPQKPSCFFPVATILKGNHYPDVLEVWEMDYF